MSREEILRQLFQNGSITLSDYLYLTEEQKPAWSEEDERMLSRCIKSIECSKMFAEAKTFKDAKDNEINWLKTRFKFLKSQPKQEWSEEDETKPNDVIRIIENHCGLVESIRNHYVKFLKRLRPSWKPSEEQIDALKELIDDANRAGWVTPGATELYEELKKL